MSEQSRPVRWVCVFCGARPGDKASYADSAHALGEVLAEKGIGLVYGASGLGLMGVLAKAVLDGGGDVIGVIPHHLVEREQMAGQATQLYLVKSMHDRKSLMYRLADAFVVLPGGYGSMDELMETLTWSKLGLHEKPTAILNVEGYYDPLIQWFDRARESGFIDIKDRELVQIADSVEGVLKALRLD
ncbi:LOG family protein ORF6 in fasciation locus [Streptomyces sp. S4.7]|uniref:LOG family protein n=1 Tax=Streptomyces sp. S4.7 TaxID=2705439 RepID=UPI0013986D59|nr:TIGR00730 family Rossman fold protein [Streptomyces sp. S4.7]QHY99220.1 LOG family protein ORF6 in fasciation locus [Streptomyces sp. S4.7]